MWTRYPTIVWSPSRSSRYGPPPCTYRGWFPTRSSIATFKVGATLISSPSRPRWCGRARAPTASPSPRPSAGRPAPASDTRHRCDPKCAHYTQCTRCNEQGDHPVAAPSAARSRHRRERAADARTNRRSRTSNVGPGSLFRLARQRARGPGTGKARRMVRRTAPDLREHCVCVHEEGQRRRRRQARSRTSRRLSRWSR